MGECVTCEGSAEERYTMVLAAETVLDDVLRCDPCYDSYDEISWIEIEAAPATPVDGSPCRATEAMD